MYCVICKGPLPNIWYFNKSIVFILFHTVRYNSYREYNMKGKKLITGSLWKTGLLILWSYLRHIINKPYPKSLHMFLKSHLYIEVYVMFCRHFKKAEISTFDKDYVAIKFNCSSQMGCRCASIWGKADKWNKGKESF